MRDEETGSWWQQVNGQAILGPLKGKKLKSVMHDEISFAIWKREQSNGRVLRPDERIVQSGGYAPANWEEQMNRFPVATRLVDNTLPQRELVAGVRLNQTAKAYPLSALQKQNTIVDTIGGVPVVIVVAEDGKSVRAFESVVEGKRLEFFNKPNSSPLRFTDSETGSEWDFTGTAVSGPLSGTHLNKVVVLLDYWFDWKTYNPNTSLYALGQR